MLVAEILTSETDVAHITLHSKLQYEYCWMYHWKLYTVSPVQLSLDAQNILY